MNVENKKTEAIPLSELFRDEDGIRNALMVMGESHSDPKLRQALARELMPLAAKGVRFPSGRRAGSMGEKVKHVYQLARDNPDLSAKRLYTLADKRIIGEMAERTFNNHVSAARKSSKRSIAKK